MGFMPASNDEEWSAPEGFKDNFDMSAAQSSTGPLTVGKLIEVFSALDPDAIVQPLMVGPDGQPLLDMMVAGLGATPDGFTALIMVYPGTREEWQGISDE